MAIATDSNPGSSPLTSPLLAMNMAATLFRLTPLETKLLETLLLNAGQVLTSEMLITAVWGNEGGDKTMLKQLVYRLRGKLDTDAAGAAQIETIPGVGYSLRQI